MREGLGNAGTVNVLDGMDLRLWEEPLPPILGVVARKGFRMKYAAIALAMSATAAAAECFPTPQVYEVIGGGQFQEYRMGAGMTPDMQVWLELWVNPETGTFTMLATLPNGQSCVIASGDGWQEFTAPGNL